MSWSLIVSIIPKVYNIRMASNGEFFRSFTSQSGIMDAETYEGLLKMEPQDAAMALASLPGEGMWIQVIINELFAHGDNLTGNNIITAQFETFP